MTGRYYRFLFPLLVFLFLFFIFFYQVLFQDRLFGFRDETFFYYPLFQQIQIYWNQGFLPLWDPYEAFGQPLAANPTSSVFYPLKLLFFLPVSYSSAYKIYILIHYPIAFLGFYILLRFWRMSSSSAVLGGGAYTFSGLILFQYSNIIYLVGAALLPWSIFYGDRLLREKKISYCLALGIIGALMILGGEPESVYFSGLLLVFLHFFRLRGEVTDSDTSNLMENHCLFRRRRVFKFLESLLLLLISSVIMFVLSSVQIIPSLEYAKASDRITTQYPQSLWNLPSWYLRHSQEGKMEQDIIADIGHGLLYSDKDLLEKHAVEIYHFSISPIQWGEFIWPNFSGRLFPENTHWASGFSNIVPWTVSLYMGIVPLIFAVSVFRLFGRRKCGAKRGIFFGNSPHLQLRNWASWVVLISFLAAMGGMGPHWFYRLIRYGYNGPSSLEIGSYDPVGGVYWGLNMILPWFSAFRYPAKLMTPAVFALAVLAGLGWEIARKNQRLPRIVLFFLFLTLGVFLLFIFGGKTFFQEIIPVHTGIYGSYRPDRAQMEMGYSLLYSMTILLVFYLLLKTGFLNQSSKSKKGIRRGHLYSSLIFILAVFDLCYINRGLVVTVPTQLFEEKSVCRSLISENEYRKGCEFDLSPLRCYREYWIPHYLCQDTRFDRLAFRILWENSTFSPKYHYRNKIAIVDVTGAMTFYSCHEFWKRQFGQSRSLEEQMKVLAFLDIRYLLSPDEREDRLSPIASLHKIAETDYQANSHVRTKKRYPIDVLLYEVLPAGSRIKIYHDTTPLDDPKIDIMELAAGGMSGDGQVNEYANIVQYGFNRIIMDIHLEEPADLLLIEQYDPNWNCVVRQMENLSSRNVKIESCKGFLRRLSLPAGDWQVTMEYRPISFYVGLIISLCGWFLVGGILIVTRWKIIGR